DGARERFLAALAHYAALTLERARLVAESAHDLRTPLTTIKALAQAAALRGDENAVASEEQADRLSRLVTDLLDFSRLNSGGRPVTPELNTAEDLVGAAVRQVSGLSGGRAVATSGSCDEAARGGRWAVGPPPRRARRLAELQGGSLEHAARPGGGSLFVLRLPAGEESL